MPYPKMPDGLTRLPDEYKKTNDGIERLIGIMLKNGGEASGLAKLYRDEFKKLAQQQAANQRNASVTLKAMKEAGVSKTEREAWIMRKSGLYEGDKDLYELMKSNLEELKKVNENTEIKDDTEKTLAEAQIKMLEKYLKNQDAYFKENDKREKTLDKRLKKEKENEKKPKAVKWLEEKTEKYFGKKAEAAKEKTKSGAVKFGAAALTALVGPLRLITDPLLALADTSTSEVFEKALTGDDEKDGKKKKGAKTVSSRHGVTGKKSYSDEYDLDESFGGKADPFNDWSLDEDEQPKTPANKKKGSGTVKKTAPEKGKADPFNDWSLDEDEQDNDGFDLAALEKIVQGAGDNNPGMTEDSFGDSALLASIGPTRSDLLKRGGIIGAAAIYLGDIITGGILKDSITDVKDGDGGGKDGSGIINNLLGGSGKGGIKGMIAKALPVAVGDAVAVAIPLALAAGAVALQKRDTEDAKKYADRGEHGRAVETFLLGDRERVTEETAGKELGRTAGKAALAGGAIAGGVAAGGFIASGGAAAAAGAATAAGAGTLGAAGAAGAAALGAVVPPVLIAAAIAAAAAAVAKGTQEAYELEYDKNAATIQRDLQRLISDEETPFLKKVGAGFKSDWIALTSTLAGGIRGAAEVMDVEAERHVQRQLETLKKQAEEGDENSARLYDMMSQQSFREMSKKEKEKLLRSEGLYEEYLKVVSDTDASFWEKLKAAVKTVKKGVENAIDTAHENFKGAVTERWESEQLKNMDKELQDKETVDRLKNSETYQTTLGETGDPLKAMQQAFLDEKRQKAIARGDLDKNGMVVDVFDKLKLGFKSFTDISDEAIKQSTEFDTRRLQLLAEGKTAEEADQQALEEQRELLNEQMELKLKQTKEYKEAFDRALKEGKSLKEAEQEALKKVKGNKKYLQSFGQKLSEGLKNLWESARNFGSNLWEGARNLGTNVWNRITGRAGGDAAASGGSLPTPSASIDDGIVYKDGKVIKISDDDNVIATKSEPVIGDRETNKAAAVPVAPAVKEFSDGNIVDALMQILAALKEKEFSPVINSGGGDGVMDFDGLRTAGGVL